MKALLENHMKERKKKEDLGVDLEKYQEYADAIVCEMENSVKDIIQKENLMKPHDIKNLVQEMMEEARKNMLDYQTGMLCQIESNMKQEYRFEVERGVKIIHKQMKIDLLAEAKNYQKIMEERFNQELKKTNSIIEDEIAEKIEEHSFLVDEKVEKLFDERLGKEDAKIMDKLRVELNHIIVEIKKQRSKENGFVPCEPV